MGRIGIRRSLRIWTTGRSYIPSSILETWVFCFLIIWHVFCSEINRQKHIGVGTWIKNYSFNRRDRYIEVLFWQRVSVFYGLRKWASDIFHWAPPLTEILRTPMRRGLFFFRRGEVLIGAGTCSSPTKLFFFESKLTSTKSKKLNPNLSWNKEKYNDIF